jgi:hypothetical protein
MGRDCSGCRVDDGTGDVVVEVAMKQVWKFVLSGTLGNYLMPKGAQLLSVAEQRGDVCLWALVDPSAPKECRILSVVGTGWDYSPSLNAKFIGTVLLDHGTLVFHVFEEIE